MNLAEVLAAALVLATASSGSLQIWAASAAAAKTAEQRSAQLLLLDRGLLEAEAWLRQGALVPGSDCGQAAAAMAAVLETAPLPPGLRRAVQVEGEGLWLRLQGEGLPERQRWLDAAAVGACIPNNGMESSNDDPNLLEA
jgi:hypothetical protein